VIPEEDLKQMLRELAGQLDELANSDKPLTAAEKKSRAKFRRRQLILSEVKRARDNKQADAELFHTSVYNAVVPWGEEHPVMLFFLLIAMRMKWSSGSFIR
jgi:hypothetical protein